jgi:hypothetical protein
MSVVREFLGSKAGLAFCLLVAAVGAYLLWTHTGHVLYALPYLFLLACPLMHFFGHGGHDHGHSHSPRKGEAQRPQNRI